MKSVASWLLLTASVLYSLARGPLWNWHGALWDYAVCASSSYEWLRGGDPYDNGRVLAGWAARGSAVDMSAHAATLRAIVPPPTLVLLAPFATLPQRAGALLYLLVCGVLLGLAIWRCGVWMKVRSGNEWRLLIAATLASVPLTAALLSGNPVLLAVPLILIGLERSLNGSPRWGGVMLGVGTACKMQIGAPLVLAVWLLGQRRAPVWAAATAIAIGGVGAVRSAVVDQNVWHKWLANVAETNVAGGLNDFARRSNAIDLLNLQAPIFHLTGVRVASDVVAWGIVIALMIAAATWNARRTHSLLGQDDPRHPLAIAFTSSLLLLPVYHRVYDGLILLPVLALMLRGMRNRTERRLVAATLICLAAHLVPANVPSRLAGLGLLPMKLVDAPAFLGTIGAHKAWATLGVAMLLVMQLRKARPARDGVIAVEAAH